MPVSSVSDAYGSWTYALTPSMLGSDPSSSSLLLSSLYNTDSSLESSLKSESDKSHDLFLLSYANVTPLS